MDIGAIMRTKAMIITIIAYMVTVAVVTIPYIILKG